MTPALASSRFSFPVSAGIAVVSLSISLPSLNTPTEVAV